MSQEHDPLDGWLREQLSNAPHPYDESHWQDALSMLEAAEPKRRRKGIFWWFTFGLAFLAGDVLFTHTHPTLNPELSEIVAQDTPPATSHAPAVVLKTKVPVIATIESSADDISKKNKQTTQPSAPDKAVATPGFFRKNKTAKGQETPPVTATAASEQTSAFAPQNTATTGIPPEQIAENQAIAPKENPKRKSLVLGTVSEMESRANPLKYTLNNQPWPAPVLDIAKGHWQLGWGLALNYYGLAPQAGENANAIPVNYPVPRIFLRWEPQSPWAFQLGAQYEIAPIRNETLGFSNRTYSFGFQTDSALLTPSAMHLVRIPLRIERNFLPQHSLFVGTSLGYVVGVRGAWTNIQASSFELQSSPGTAQWVRSPYRKFDVMAQAGYSYQLSNGMRLGLTGSLGVFNRHLPDLWPTGTAPSHYHALSIWWETNLNRRKP